jgi:hypothetical protein
MYIKNIKYFFGSRGGGGIPIPISGHLPVLSAKKEKQASITGNASILKKVKLNIIKISLRLA